MPYAYAHMYVWISVGPVDEDSVVLKLHDVVSRQIDDSLSKVVREIENGIANAKGPQSSKPALDESHIPVPERREDLAPR